MAFKELKRAIVVSYTYAIVYSIAVSIAFFLILQTVYAWFKSSRRIFWKKRRELPPSVLNDPSYGEHSYIQIQNVKLHYVEKGDRSKPLMLFLHGFPEFWYSWRYQIKHFSKDYWTVAVDLRGFGDSEKPVGISQYKIKYVVNDVKNLITALGKEKCILVSHDWGAIVGWYFLLKYPDMLDKYVVLGIQPLFATPSSWSQILLSWYIYFIQIPYLPELYFSLGDLKLFNAIFKGFSSNDDIEAYKFTFGKPGAFTCGLNYYRANILQLIFSLRTKPADVRFPKGLLIYTDNDPYVSVSNFKTAKDDVENLEVSLIEGATHFIQLRKHEEVNNLISKFLGITATDDPGHAKSVQSDDPQT